MFNEVLMLWFYSFDSIDLSKLISIIQINKYSYGSLIVNEKKIITGSNLITYFVK